MVHDVDYTALDGMELSCKDECEVAVPVRKDVVINKVSKSYSVVSFAASRIAGSHVAQTV